MIKLAQLEVAERCTKGVIFFTRMQINGPTKNKVFYRKLSLKEVEHFLIKQRSRFKRPFFFNLNKKDKKNIFLRNFHKEKKYFFDQRKTQWYFLTLSHNIKKYKQFLYPIEYKKRKLLLDTRNYLLLPNFNNLNIILLFPFS